MADKDSSSNEEEDKRNDKQDYLEELSTSTALEVEHEVVKQQPVLVSSLCLDMGRPSVARVRPRPRPRPRPVAGCGDTAEVFTLRHQRRGSLVIAGFK